MVGMEPRVEEDPFEGQATPKEEMVPMEVDMGATQVMEEEEEEDMPGDKVCRMNLLHDIMTDTAATYSATTSRLHHSLALYVLEDFLFSFFHFVFHFKEQKPNSKHLFPTINLIVIKN